MTRVPAVTDSSPIVIEFFGLPGAGKTTIANHLAEVLRKRGYEVRTAVDFIDWLAQQSKLTKLGFLISGMRGACRQLFWCTLFGIRMSPPSAISFSRIIRVPYINVCFERYLATANRMIVVMDQANVQLIWSIGALAAEYDRRLLFRACEAVTDGRPRYFVCLTPNVPSTCQRLITRDTSQSRFDGLRHADLSGALKSASRLILDIKNILKDQSRHLSSVDSTMDPRRNACGLADRYLNEHPFNSLNQKWRRRAPQSQE